MDSLPLIVIPEVFVCDTGKSMKAPQRHQHSGNRSIFKLLHIYK